MKLGSSDMTWNENAKVLDWRVHSQRPKAKMLAEPTLLKKATSTVWYTPSSEHFRLADLYNPIPGSFSLHSYICLHYALTKSNFCRWECLQVMGWFIVSFLLSN